MRLGMLTGGEGYPAGHAVRRDPRAGGPSGPDRTPGRAPVSRSARFVKRAATPRDPDFPETVRVFFA